MDPSRSFALPPDLPLFFRRPHSILLAARASGRPRLMNAYLPTSTATIMLILQAAMERVLGTVTGGMLGFLLAICNDALPPIAQPFITVFAATCVAFTSIILGSRFKIDYAGRLFIMTFVLVAMAAPRKAGELMLTLKLPKKWSVLSPDEVEACVDFVNFMPTSVCITIYYEANTCIRFFHCSCSYNSYRTHQDFIYEMCEAHESCGMACSGLDYPSRLFLAASKPSEARVMPNS